MKFSNKFSQSVFSLLFLCLSLFELSQDKPYWQDIKDFKTKDQQNGIPKRAILFIGSSSFTKWQDVNDYFPGKTIINRGFGGSRLVDLNNYANDLIPNKSSSIVVIMILLWEILLLMRFSAGLHNFLAKSARSIPKCLWLMCLLSIRRAEKNYGLR